MVASFVGSYGREFLVFMVAKRFDPRRLDECVRVGNKM